MPGLSMFWTGGFFSQDLLRPSAARDHRVSSLFPVSRDSGEIALWYPEGGKGGNQGCWPGVVSRDRESSTRPPALTVGHRFPLLIEPATEGRGGGRTRAREGVLCCASLGNRPTECRSGKVGMARGGHPRHFRRANGDSLAGGGSGSDSQVSGVTVCRGVRVRTRGL